jgi:hypothetical protein
VEKVKKSGAIKAYKVFNPDWTCSPNGKRFQYEIGKSYKHAGNISICNSGFHACLQVQHCFSYYSFNPQNKVAEVLIWGDTATKPDDSKICGSEILIVREVPWPEVLVLANTGSDNTGHSNSGDSNSGYSNSGSWNSGSWNSGSWNSGDRNSGYSNSGSWNSGSWNSGSWNSGDRNSGDSNSGYRNSGAFCTDPNPEVWLFDKPSGIKVQDWERHKAVQILNQSLETHIWIYGNSMSDAEKEAYPKWETTDGYLKAISLQEAWANMWPNLNDASKKVFLDLPHFDSKKFKAITGIDVVAKKEKKSR